MGAGRDFSRESGRGADIGGVGEMADVRSAAALLVDQLAEQFAGYAAGFRGGDFFVAKRVMAGSTGFDAIIHFVADNTKATAQTSFRADSGRCRAVCGTGCAVRD